MKKNEGGLDRGVRVVLAAILFFLGTVVLTGIGSIVASILGVVMFITAITGFCGVYTLLGINTKSEEK